MEKLIEGTTPKYLGVTETVAASRTAIITKGERLGAVDANTGDWVLSGKTIGGWKVGLCYKWSGLAWKPLEPAINYAKEYHACLLHICEIEDLMKETGHFGALFARTKLFVLPINTVVESFKHTSSCQALASLPA